MTGGPGAEEERGRNMEQKILKSGQLETELRQILEEKKSRSVLLVCGNSFRGQKLYGRLCAFLKESGICLTEFSDFQPNPRYESVVKGVEVLIEKQCDFVIAAGGGSAMDTAKCIKLFSNMDHGKNYLKQEIVENELPLAAIPTTAGTGSEATRFAVIYYGGNKQSVSHESGIPAYVILDASLLTSLPLYQRKATMLDAFCHAVESFWSVNSTKESRAYSAKAIGLLLKYKELYLANDPMGNEQMLLAANLAGKAINITQTTAGHAMSYKLTGLYGLAHGHAAALCVAVIWPHMAGHPEDCVDPRGAAYLQRTFEEIAKAMGCDTVKESIDKYREMLLELKMSIPVMKEEGELEILKKSVNPVRLKNNPVLLDEKTLGNLYGQIFAGL